MNQVNAQSINKIQSLKKTKYRKLYNKFLIEGKRLVFSAVENDDLIETIYCTDKFYNKNLKYFLNINNVIIKYISENNLKKISSTKNPSGIAAICYIQKQKQVPYKKKRWLYIDKIREPGNLGTIFRAALWFNLKNIALSPKSVDPFNPKTIRAGMGAHFSLNIYQNIKLEKFIQTHTLIAAHKEGMDVEEFKFPKKHVIVIGNEAHGISSKNNKLIEKFITIKKLGLGESLNVASASSIIMFLATNKK